MSNNQRKHPPYNPITAFSSRFSEEPHHLVKVSTASRASKALYHPQSDAHDASVVYGRIMLHVGNTDQLEVLHYTSEYPTDHIPDPHQHEQLLCTLSYLQSVTPHDLVQRTDCWYLSSSLMSVVESNQFPCDRSNPVVTPIRFQRLINRYRFQRFTRTTPDISELDLVHS